MINLTSIFESIERLAYDILIWVLLVPKTLIKIVTNPAWVPDYVTGELRAKTELKFDDYLSPVILIILTSLVPFLYFYLTPPPSVTIAGPDSVEINTTATFEASVDFISNKAGGNYRYLWQAEDQEDRSYLNAMLWDQNWFTWDSLGGKTIRVTVTNDEGETLEQTKYVYVYHPSHGPPQERLSGVQRPEKNDKEDYLSALQGPVGILSTLIILSIPLLFAIATDGFRGDAITRSSLRPSFYIQCYYFAPVNLTVWALLIGNYFFLTPKEVELRGLTVLIMLVMLLWIIWNETSLIVKEGRIHPVLSFFIVLVCLAAVVGVGIGLLFLRDTEILRLFIQYTYFGIVGFVILIYIMKEYISPWLRKD